MKIELDHREYVWPRKRKHTEILDIKVSLDIGKLLPQTKTRIKNALMKGYYGSGSNTTIGIGIREIAKLHNLPVIFCNRAHWTCGLTFHNISNANMEKIKEYIKNMSDIAGITIQTDSFFANLSTPKETRWAVRVERNEDKQYKANTIVRKDFANILKGSMLFYVRELLSQQDKERLEAVTKEF